MTPSTDISPEVTTSVPEPYRSEILPHLQIKNAGVARQSATALYSLFVHYRGHKDYRGMDSVKKLLHAGFLHLRRPTRAGVQNQAEPDGNALPLNTKHRSEQKKQTAHIFYRMYMHARLDPIYLQLKNYYQSRYYSS